MVHKKHLSNRVVNDVVMALVSLDSYQEAIQATDGKVSFKPRALTFDSETRLQLARNLQAFTQVEAGLRQRHEALVRALDPVVDGEALQVPKERLGEFQRRWSQILDDTQELEFHPFPVGGLHGGSNNMPLSLLAYLFNLADVESIQQRFAVLAEPVSLRRRDAGLLLATLMELEGRVLSAEVFGPNGVSQRPATLPWNFAPTVRENLAYNFFALYQIGVHINQRRGEIFADLGERTAEVAGEAAMRQLEQFLSEFVEVPLIRMTARDLDLESNAIPLGVLNRLETLLLT